MLEPLPEDWTRALAVVAHPDDMEYGAASAVARWTDQGKWVGYCLVTAGEAGIAGMEPAEATRLRRVEQEASCAAVGVDDLRYLDHPDGQVENDLVLRRDLAEVIRATKPDVLISINHRDSWGGPSWNHVDHRNVGRALLDAARDAGNEWLFPDAGPAWSGVKFVAFGSSPESRHCVDVTDTIDRGIASLECHRVYLDALDEPPDPDAFLRGAAKGMGDDSPFDLAVAFELVYV